MFDNVIEKKERDEKKACQRSMTPKERERERERERKDGMPKKHDPAIKPDMKRSMYLSVH